MLHDERVEDEFRFLWEQKWSERENLLIDLFGPTEPSGIVISFPWEGLGFGIPGACALPFPPRVQEREHWLYLSHGLTQPADLDPDSTEDDPPVTPGVSGYGWEFAVLTSQSSDWAPVVLYQILAYVVENRAWIDVGHRLPMVFYPGEGNELQPILRSLDPSDPYPPIGSMRALLIWPYLLHPEPLSTSTGSFGLLVGTTITQAEWELAKETSSTHLQLLLCKEGVGQLSDPERSCITDSATFQEHWHQIRHLDFDQVERELQEGS